MPISARRPVSASRGRPALNREDADVYRRLIRAGLAHLTEKGYSAVSLDEILQAAAAPKGSFYHYFRSKADFGSRLIAAYDEYFVGKLEGCLSNEALSPLERLRAFTADAERGMERHGFRRGCLVGNLGQEMGALPEPFRDQLVRILQGWQERTARCLQLARDRGELGAHHSPEALAAYFWIGWEGAVLRAKLERRAEPLHIFSDIFFRSLHP
ncbi:TetR/AcrR family transcriptional regulator [Rhizobiaceae bacterium BDR2-2]|uniref:TetR/AcrR family transcriptional regulator n=1 Tax=Ectorhizobium quercum TaxID=2965071 RepID=A0AAE3SVP6_9HYPH|nr:TetR/AcrR family transcriptional regulator [Ectorhizobium quercum]MCX8998347.1 TetR/AcrR family transcriptional regulator [Ectorhizobium quercum]